VLYLGCFLAQQFLHDGCHVEQCLLAVPDKETVLLSVAAARRMNPKLRIVARAVRDHQVEELLAKGVDAVIQPEFEGGIEMVRQALLRYPYDETRTTELIAGLRRELYG